MKNENKLKKIALVISASNYERQKNIVKAMHEKIKQLDNYVLYVFTSYGLYYDDKPYDRGEFSIYDLLYEMDFDGCILEGNVTNELLVQKMMELFVKKKIPFVTVHVEMLVNAEIPFFTFDSYAAGRQIMHHLLEEHHCTKINLVKTPDNGIISSQLLCVYKEMLEKYNIPFDSRRVVDKIVSLQNGKELFHIFKERGVDDAEATICLHDVLAIGLCLEMEAHGFGVPEDMLLCSLNRSVNSLGFSPSITGVDRMDTEVSQAALTAVIHMIEKKEVFICNLFQGKIYYGESCGCGNRQQERNTQRRKECQDIIVGKVEAGNQISRMMNYNDSLEGVTSIDELGNCVHKMLQGINCKEYAFCMNKRSIKYILNEEISEPVGDGRHFDRNMVAVTGITKREGKLKNVTFPITQLVPMETRAGDILLFIPVHHKEQVYGYMCFLNECLPIELYNYRICHESIGISIENLRRQMILQNSIKELDKLHMQDALTGLYNRFAWNRFYHRFVENRKYCVVMIDMDNMKKINDNFGHLAGNHAICIVANVIKNIMQPEDLVIRYGGDEFQILSYNIDSTYWEKMKQHLNAEIDVHVKQQMLPYPLGVSLGYAICNEQKLSFEECCEMADKAMYEEKKVRKTEA